MARPCPACSRPNADAADKCLYRSERLPPVSEEDIRAEVPGLEGGDRHLLIIIPSGEAPEDRVERFSEITGVAKYDARLILQATRPRLFRRVETETEARELSRRLTQARIAHYVVADRAVRSMPVSRARGGAFNERHLQLRLDGKEVAIPYTELLLVVRGEIAREHHDEKRLGSGRGVSRPLSPGTRLYLFAREASVAVEIDPDRFDWTLLGSELSRSSLLNVERFSSRLGALAPGARFDRGFNQEPIALSRSEAVEDLTQMLSGSEKGRRGVLYDNEAQFRFYARWRYRLERHLERSDS